MCEFVSLGVYKYKICVTGPPCSHRPAAPRLTERDGIDRREEKEGRDEREGAVEERTATSHRLHS